MIWRPIDQRACFIDARIRAQITRPTCFAAYKTRRWSPMQAVDSGGPCDAFEG